MSHRLLIAVSEPVETTEQLPSSIRSLIDTADEVLVIAPSLPSRLRWLFSDTDQATERADERLRVVLGQLDELGAAARGRVGSDDPLEAFEDAVREFDPDHILVALRPAGAGGLAGTRADDEVLVRFGRPVTVFVSPDA